MLNKSLFGAALMTAFAAGRDYEIADTDGWCFDEVDLGEEVEQAAANDGTTIKMYIDDSNHIARELPPTIVYGSPVGCWEFHAAMDKRYKFEVKDDGTVEGESFFNDSSWT